MRIEKRKHKKLLLNYALLTRQLAKLSDCIFHIIRVEEKEKKDHQNKDGLVTGYTIYAQSELSDALAQIEQMCICLELDFNKTLSMGRIRYIEKAKSFKEKNPGEEWI